MKEGGGGGPARPKDGAGLERTGDAEINIIGVVHCHGFYHHSIPVTLAIIFLFFFVQQ